jgi:UDP:flavonoid glycosyltransferase YjiC (YdhE family)
MARVLCAWELGGGMGHATRLLAVAERLRARGHEVIFALRDLFLPGQLIAGRDFPLLQAPVWQARSRGMPDPVSYPELLFRFGYLDPKALTPMVRAWQGLLHSAEPELVLFDHAPTALVAAQGMVIQRIIIGNTFTVPPLTSPMPAFITEREVPQERLRQAEERVTRTIDTVAREMGASGIQTLGDLFEVERTLLCSFPELDHYPGRANGTYVGPILEPSGQKPPQWPEGRSARVFAYLKAEHPATRPVLDALTRMQVRSVIHCPDLSPTEQAQRSEGSLQVVREPVAIQQAVKEADAVICHGGLGTVTTALQGGTPVMALPGQQEQQILASRLAETGAGQRGRAGEESGYEENIAQLLENATYRERARGFAETYRAWDPERVADWVAGECQLVLSERA